MTYNLVETILLIVLIFSLVVKVSINTLNKISLVMLIMSFMFSDFLGLENYTWGLMIKTLCLTYGLLFINCTSSSFILSTEMLMMCMVLASLLMVSTSNFLSLYLCLELQSLSMFMFINSKKNSLIGVEASIKYFVLSSLSSGSFLLGSALIFLANGSCDYILLSYDSFTLESSFMLVALLFKLAASPFHFWTPDVYQGSDNKALLILAMLPKLSVFGILVFLLFSNSLLMVAIILSMLMGSVGAINQSSFKSLLGYSSIFSMGFILFGFNMNTLEGLQGSFLYLMVYLATFCIIILIFWSMCDENSLMMEVSNCLMFNKILASTFIVSILSVAGMPPLGGFMAKWLMLSVSINQEYILISMLSIMCTFIAGMYYLSLVKIVYFGHSSLFMFWRMVLSSDTKGFMPHAPMGVMTYFLFFLLLIFQTVIQVIHFGVMSLF